MPFDVAVVTGAATPHRIAPVRFARAASGFSELDAPDLDDHGFTLPAQFATARGPVTGVMKNHIIRVKIIRDRLETAANLFVTSGDDSIAAIDFPAAGTPLSTADIPADPQNHTPARPADCVFIRGTSTARGSVETLISVRHGSATGPILAQLCVRVYPILTINVQVHDVSINGVDAGIDIDDARNLFGRVNRVYAQAGVQFHVLPSLRTETLTGFARAGAVTLPDLHDERNVELQTVLNSHPLSTALNAYFVPGYHDPTQTDVTVLGIAFSRTIASANPPDASRNFPGCQAGITCFFGDDLHQVARTAAHELGHAFTLEHYNRGQQHDLWSHRCLMHFLINLDFTDLPVGYGTFDDNTICAGDLLMTKGRPHISQSEQINTLRRAILNDSYKPLSRP